MSDLKKIKSMIDECNRNESGFKVLNSLIEHEPEIQRVKYYAFIFAILTTVNEVARDNNEGERVAYIVNEYVMINVDIFTKCYNDVLEHMVSDFNVAKPKVNANNFMDFLNIVTSFSPESIVMINRNINLFTTTYSNTLYAIQ
jgi:hypothetical protein